MGRWPAPSAARYGFVAGAAVDGRADDQPHRRPEVREARARRRWMCARRGRRRLPGPRACWSSRGMSSSSSPKPRTPSAAHASSLAQSATRSASSEYGSTARARCSRRARSRAGGPALDELGEALERRRRRRRAASRGARVDRPSGRRRRCSCHEQPRKSISARRCVVRPRVAVEPLDDAPDREWRRWRHRTGSVAAVSRPVPEPRTRALAASPPATLLLVYTLRHDALRAPDARRPPRRRR